VMEQDFILRHEEGKFFLLVREGENRGYRICDLKTPPISIVGMKNRC